MVDRVGQQLGNYRLIRLLGEGGFAEVYLGEHIHLGTRSAIKVLHAQLTSEDMEKFRTEARNLAGLIHPHIVRVLDFGIENKTPFLVMDYAPHGTLRQHHPRGKPVPLNIIVSYVKQVASALQYAHDQKLIHRDVKPENMLLGRNDEILLSDFGIAVVAQSTRYQGAQDIAGTIAYMAPEQIQAHPRPASDQYSLGIVVYEWLCGERPFHGGFSEVAIKHTIVPPPSLREKIPTLLRDVEQVVMMALDKDPKERFLNVQAFAIAFEQASLSALAHPRPLPPSFSSESKSSTVDVPVPPSPSVNIPTTSPRGPTEPISAPHSFTLPSTLPYVPITPAREVSGQHERQQPTTTEQIEGFTQVLPAKKGPGFALVIGTILLLMVLIGGSVFFFSKSVPSFNITQTNNSTNTGGNTSNSSNSNTALTHARGCTKIGVLLPETATSARWESKDRSLLMNDIKNALPGATVDYSNAQGNADLQQTQAQADLTNGDCILVIAPSDSIKAAAIVSVAKAKGVPVIAYDRLIYSNDLNYYVSFDNTKVGQLQGQYVADHYQSFVSSNGTKNTVMIDGSQTDNNALLFAKGAHSALDPLFNSGALKKVYEIYTPNWDNPTAQTEMQAALTANLNKVAVAYVANDGMANSVIAALKAQGLNGKVLVTGQDATVAGIHSILAGDQAMTVYKAIAKEAAATADLVAAISKGTITSSSLINGQTTTSDGTQIPSVLETPVTVDKTNIAATVIADGYVTPQDVCVGLPSGTDGICP